MAASAETEALLEQLASTPRRLAALSQGLEATQLQAAPGADAWSTSDILAHLRACADVWGKSIMAMLQKDHPTLRYVSPRAGMRKPEYTGLPFAVALQAYSARRAELLAALYALPAAGWARGATFTGTTRGREQTVLSYAQRIAAHELEHLDQIESLLPGTGGL